MFYLYRVRARQVQINNLVIQSYCVTVAEFPFTHSCAYMTHKSLKGRSLFPASASQGRTEVCSFQSHLSALSIYSS